MENEENTNENHNIHGNDNQSESISIARSIIRLALPKSFPAPGCSTQNSGATTECMHLPGSVSPIQTSKQTKINLSKSEHAIHQISLDAEFAKSLLLSSVSFAPNVKFNCSKNGEHSKILPDPNKSIPAGSTTCAEDDVNVPEQNTIKTAPADPTLVPDVNPPNVIIANPVLVRNDLLDTRTEQTGNRIETALIRSVENEAAVTNRLLGLNEVKVHQPLIGSKGSLQKPTTPNLLLVPGDSLSSIGSNVCRICMTKGRERLISPCHCKGSMANVHLSCLERWLNQVGRNQCELCGYSYPAIRTPRYTVLQALRLWFGNPRNRSHLQSDCLIFWLLSTVTAGLLAVCIMGTQYFVVEGNKTGKLDEGVPHRFTETAMDFFMAVVVFGYSLTTYLLWRDHFVMWNRWRRANVNVRLLLAPDARPVPFVPRAGFHV